MEPGEPAESATSEVPSMDTGVAATITIDGAPRTASAAGSHEESDESERLSSDELEDRVPAEAEIINEVWDNSRLDPICGEHCTFSHLCSTSRSCTWRKSPTHAGITDAFVCGMW